MARIEATFPSSEWFAALVSRANADRPQMDRLGIAQLRLGVEIQENGSATLFGIVLDGYDIESVGLVEEADFRPEVTVTGPVEAWREMVAAIEANNGADAGHTLNSLAIAGVPLTVRSGDPMGADKFFRFMGTLQAIFDAAGSPAVVGASH
ncbi:MAG: hypothetical protein ACYDGN_06335 [Acidimicrobiales bacterium]